MPGEAQTGAYESKCDKQACVGARLGWEAGHSWLLQVANFSPHLFWNCLLIRGTLHTKLILKPSPSILTFQALHQVTQGHPSFLMRAGVDLILDLFCPCRSSISSSHAKACCGRTFLQAPKPPKLSQKNQTPLVRMLKCQ